VGHALSVGQVGSRRNLLPCSLISVMYQHLYPACFRAAVVYTVSYVDLFCL
jgi:hypothetical protein